MKEEISHNKREIESKKIAFLIKVTSWFIGILVVGFISSLFFSGYLFTDNVIDISISGQIGDFFGGVIGSLLSFLSILYLIENIRVMNHSNQISENKNIQEQKEKFSVFLKSPEVNSMKSQFESHYRPLKALPKMIEISYDMTLGKEISSVDLSEFTFDFRQKFANFELCSVLFNLYIMKVTTHLGRDSILTNIQKNQLVLESIGNLNNRFGSLMEILIQYRNVLKTELTKTEIKSLDYHIEVFTNYRSFFV